MRASELRELLTLHTGVARRLQAALAARPRPASDDRVDVVGPDPLRLLVIGAGMAVGYGVTRREDALDGLLARELAARTGRGVVAEHRIRADVPTARTIELLGASGAHTYDLVVWCPTFTALPRTWRTSRWLVDLRRIMTHLTTTGDRRTRYLLTGYPVIGDEGALERIANLFVHRVNARIARAAGEFPRTVFAYPPAVHGIGHALDRAYYERCVAEFGDALDRAGFPQRAGRAAG